MAINFSNNGIKFFLKEKTRLKNWIKKVIELQNKKTGEISYLFCDDEHILEVNQTYLNHDTYTDIITFDYVDGDVISGDILISVDRVGENAEKFGLPFEQELHRVMIHGVLHLLGNKDKTDSEAKSMRAKEDEALNVFEEM